MKNLKFILLSALMIFFFSCSQEDSMRRDAKDFAKLTCESIQLMGKAIEGDITAQAKLDELSDKMEQKGEELDKKYTTPEEKQKLSEMIIEESADCE